MKTIRRKAVKIVTKDYLKERLARPDGNKVLGRALVRIYERQTADEQSDATTTDKNGQGFTAFDARMGTIAAQAFKERGYVPAGLAKYWLSPDQKGYPKICRYANQLNQVAEANLATGRTQAINPNEKTP